MVAEHGEQVTHQHLVVVQQQLESLLQVQKKVVMEQEQQLLQLQEHQDQMEV